VRTELQFSMDAHTSAPDLVGCYLMPTASQNNVRWAEEHGRAFVTVTVVESGAEAVKRRICRLHPTVRFVKENRVDL
jgi:hypothetical protein